MAAATVSLRSAACLHCGLPVDAGRSGAFCCSGCAAVYGLLHDENLDRYYALRGPRGVPSVDSRSQRRDTKWLELVEAQLKTSDGHARLTLDLQGMHCVGCVWLIEELFAREAGHERIVVNPSLGRVDLWVSTAFDAPVVRRARRTLWISLRPPAPARREERRAISSARLGVCVAVAMNSMIFGIAIYAGLDRGPLFSLFTALNLALSVVSVAVGGSVFIRSAFRAVRRGVLHLDLPIALGITLAFAGSVHSYWTQRSRNSYFDTLDVFIALMLFGRWLQERVLERNRAWLLDSDGAEGLLTRRVTDGRVTVVSCSEILEGDVLLVAPGDLVPTDARLEGDSASFSLDWIHGESRPRTYATGDVVPAGAFAAGRRASTLRVVTSFASSGLRELLRQPERSKGEAARASAWWQTLSKVYVAGVVLIATVAFAGWWLATGDIGRAMSVTTAVLIVTCPCAFGIATPLAYEMVQAGLRRAGCSFAAPGFLDRASTVRRVVFDKTGTLTTGALVLQNPEAIDALAPNERATLYDLVARSGHPKSAAIRQATDCYGPRLDCGRGGRRVHRASVSNFGEGRDCGVSARRCGRRRPRAPVPGRDVVFGVNGHLVAALRDDGAPPPRRGRARWRP